MIRRSLLGSLLCLFLCYPLYVKSQEKGSPPLSIIITMQPIELLFAKPIEKLSYLLRSHPFTAGIFVAYEGLIRTFDANDRIVFPRKHAQDALVFFVTPTIVPITIRGNIVERLMFTDPKKSALYTLVRKKHPSGYFFWEVKEGKVPKNKIIPPHVITLCAHKEDIYVPEGIFITTGGPNLVTPPIFLQEHHDGLQNLSPLQIMRHFAQPSEIRKYQRDRYAVISY
ncbi:MAG: hypothetical protein JW725_04500 [Candidatus Babeliaceae bacterium]|nr:hypothetical protein [Candidatus Babeliaceae bacterium]